MKNVILFLILMIVFSACNNNQPSAQRSVNDSLSQNTKITIAKDSEFMAEAAEGSMMELALGRYASGHATDQRLKDYGFLIVAQHKQLLEQIRKMAEVKNINLPDTVTKEHMQLLAYLAPKAGNPFDSTYMSEIIQHQKKLADVYDKVIKSASDEDLKTYAKETIPLIMNHLLRLITLRDSININKQRLH